ncbi:SPFH domain-containing protein [Lachnospiraceae bacterium 56-18]|uniref:SPFH domain-containing protein n=1 Tax=Sporofaciens sp. JLR.KK001 TaxID=3112621 RepID=UPI002FF43234
MNKKTMIALIVSVAVAGAIFTVSSCKLIGTGKVGVQYSYKGGVKDETLNPGLNFINPFLKVKEFTVGNEQLILTKDKRDGSKKNESFKVATADDASISVSFQMSYRYNPEKVVDTYKKFKGMDGEDIVEQRVKTVLKSKISEVTTDYTMMDIYSGNRSEINNAITEYLNKDFGDSYGIEVLDASIIDVHPDEKLREAIDNRVTALQQKQQAEAEQEKIKVEAQTKLIQAENDADIKIKKAEAEAEANRVLAASITDELIRMKEAEARKEHGWVTVQGADAIVTEDK